jgi:hypothetical protein
LETARSSPDGPLQQPFTTGDPEFNGRREPLLECGKKSFQGGNVDKMGFDRLEKEIDSVWLRRRIEKGDGRNGKVLRLGRRKVRVV